MNVVGQLLDLLHESTSTVAFTGAGVSTASGIRDFRGKNGVYRDTFKGYAVEELFGLPLFEQDPSIFYEWSKDFVYAIDAHRPNIVHRVLADLEAQGLLSAVVTQNIDRLHTLAGSKTVYEIHGSPQWHHCLSCGRAYPYDDVAPTVREGRVPHCISSFTAKISPRTPSRRPSTPVAAPTSASFLAPPSPSTPPPPSPARPTNAAAASSSSTIPPRPSTASPSSASPTSSPPSPSSPPCSDLKTVSVGEPPII